MLWNNDAAHVARQLMQHRYGQLLIAPRASPLMRPSPRKLLAMERRV
jgi:hypothetical protein